MNAEKKIFIVAGVGNGDEGKGTTVDCLVRKHGIRNVVRYNGGWQAAHFVVTDGGLEHCFSQFGSGALVPGTKTFLSKYMLFNPFALQNESMVLAEKGIADAMDWVFVDRQCPVVTPFNIIINRMLELSRGDKRHGSCGKGISQTVQDFLNYGQNVLMAGDLADVETVLRKLNYFWHMRVDLAEQLAAKFLSNKRLQECFRRIVSINIRDLAEQYKFISQSIRVCDEPFLLDTIRKEGAIFEGAQGALLDKDYGFYPYVTATRTTFANAFDLIERSGYSGKIVKIAVMRAYATRHGAGPFVTEDEELRQRIPACHNVYNEWQGPFRVGWMDLVALRYGLRILGGADEIMLTNLDRLAGIKSIKICGSYARNPRSHFGETKKFFEADRDRCFQPQIIQEIKYFEKPIDVCGFQVSDILRECNPVYQLSDGWDFSGNGTLPQEMQNYIELLEASLGVPIAMISVGPAAMHKVEIN